MNAEQFLKKVLRQRQQTDDIVKSFAKIKEVEKAKWLQLKEMLVKENNNEKDRTNGI